MADLADIRAAIAAKLADALTPGIQVTAYDRLEPIPPCVFVIPGEIDWHLALEDGLEMYTMRVEALVGETTDEGPQKLLDELLASAGDRSIRAILESGPNDTGQVTLDGLVDDLIVVKTKGYQIDPHHGHLLCAEWFIHVYASGN